MSLTVGVLAAVLTANAYFPIRRWRVLILPSFFAGWLTAELAWHHVVWQLAAAGLFIWDGAFETWAGGVGVGLLLMSCAGLAFMASGRKAADAFSQVADDVALPRGRGLVPFWLRDGRVRIQRRVPYHDEAGRRHTLDLYLPPGDPEGAPVFVYIHGGGWVIGHSRQQGQPLLCHLAARGWIGVSVNYRLSPRTRFPGHIEDVKRALRWVKHNIGEHGGDPSFVAVSGGSAGAHLASLLTLTAEARAFQPGFEDETLAVQACVPLYGIYDFLDRDGHFAHGGMRMLLERLVMPTRQAADPEGWSRASPRSWVHAGAPPFCVVHGTHDNMAPPAQARAFADALREVSESEVRFVEVPFAHHAYEVFHSPRATATARGIHAFLQEVRRG